MTKPLSTSIPNTVTSPMSRPNARTIAPIALNADPAERIRWTRTDQDISRGNQLYRTRLGGKVVIERKPSRAAHGIDAELDTELSWTRTVMDRNGHVLEQNMTSSSARVMVPAKYQADPTVIEALERATKRGFIPVTACPISLVAKGDLHARHVLSDISGPACTDVPAGGCVHFLAERDARRAKNAERERATAERFRSTESKERDALVAAAGAGAAGAMAEMFAKFMAQHTPTEPAPTGKPRKVRS